MLGRGSQVSCFLSQNPSKALVLPQTGPAPQGDSSRRCGLWGVGHTQTLFSAVLSLSWTFKTSRPCGPLSGQDFYHRRRHFPHAHQVVGSSDTYPVKLGFQINYKEFCSIRMFHATCICLLAQSGHATQKSTVTLVSPSQLERENKQHAQRTQPLAISQGSFPNISTERNDSTLI